MFSAPVTGSAILHQVAAAVFPTIFLPENDRQKWQNVGGLLMDFLKETGYLHIQATKPDTIGEWKMYRILLIQ